MKTVLTSILSSIVTVVFTLVIAGSMSGCAEGSGGQDKECCEKEKTECCDKKHGESEKGHYGQEAMMKELIPFRAEFEKELSDEEKATIEDIEDKFEDDGEEHENLCPEGMAKFQEAHKDDIAALLTIANNHQKFFDDMMVKMHEKGCCDKSKEGEAGAKKEACPEAKKCKEATEKCKGEQAKDGEDGAKKEACPEAKKCKEATEKCKGEKAAEGEAVAKKEACPEAAKCKEATEKCKGEQKTEGEAKKCKETEAKCKDAEAKCKEECKAGMDTFKVHFLLMDDDHWGDEDDE